jgi:hypothetical protein
MDHLHQQNTHSYIIEVNQADDSKGLAYFGMRHVNESKNFMYEWQHTVSSHFILAVRQFD